jgi:U3 small nucleolar RNA-associated protein 23
MFVFFMKSESLKNIVRSIPGVPLLVIAHKSINLEKPSEMSNQKAAETTSKKLEAPQLPKPEEKPVFVHRKRKAKGPNPLSCKKKKKLVQPPQNQTNQAEKSKNDKS